MRRAGRRRRLPPRRGRLAAAAAARRGGGRRRRGGASHRGERRRHRHRGDRAARAREARGGAPVAAAPPRYRGELRDGALSRASGAPVDPGLLALLAAAIRDRERLRLRYRDHAGTIDQTPRRAPPARPHRTPLVSRRLGRGREDWRTFRVDRIEPRAVARGPLHARASRLPPTSPPTSRAGSAWPATRHQARVLLHAPSPTSRRGSRRHGTLEASTSSSCLLHTGADWLGGLAIYVARSASTSRCSTRPSSPTRSACLAERFTRAARSQ